MELSRDVFYLIIPFFILPSLRHICIFGLQTIRKGSRIISINSMENNADDESVEERIEMARKETFASTAEDSVATHHVIPKVSNFNVLLITAVMFGLFVIAEVVGALVSLILLSEKKIFCDN